MSSQEHGEYKMLFDEVAVQERRKETFLTVVMPRFAWGPTRPFVESENKVQRHTNPNKTYSLGNFKPAFSNVESHQQLWGKPPNSMVNLLIHSNRVEDRSNVVANLFEVGLLLYRLQSFSGVRSHKISKLFCEDCSNFFRTRHVH